MRSSRRSLLVGVIAGVLVLGACGGDDDDAAPTSETSSIDDSDDAGEAVAALTSEEVCAAVTGDDVGDALGVTVTEAEPQDSGTPQCHYGYSLESGPTSNITIASMRSDEDLGGRTGEDAYDFVVDINRASADDGDMQEVELDSGDNATRFTGNSLHLGVVVVDGRIFTVIVPADDVPADAVDALIDVIGYELSR
ncbi:MAG: hypothetical protein SGJ13_02355 [Actinomycetota bacterium]|nr:hypothetical protein [Actinomycetota bacterium]